jgi:apolipoprotein N-acyltransferase
MVQQTGASGEAGAPAAATPPAPDGRADPKPTARGLSTPLALLTALAGGLALAAAFPSAGIWPLAVVGPALLTVALWRRSLRASFAVGLVFGVVFYFSLLFWLINVAWYVWAALALIQALIFAVLAVGQRLLLRLRAWPVAVAGWWVAEEAVRDRWPWGGFPWGRLAMSQADAPTARWVAIGGPPLLTFLLALVGGTLAWVLLMPGGAGLRRRAVPIAALAGAAGLAACGALLPVDRGAPGTPSATVAAIQGDVPRARNLPTLLAKSGVAEHQIAATQNLAQLVRSGARRAPDLVIWPEDSVDLDPFFYPGIDSEVAGAVNDIDRPVLVGAVLQSPLRNAGQLWLPHVGPVAVYVKRQLVPFGETIPLRSFLEKFTSLPKLVPVNFTPGHKAVVFRIGKIRLGDVICYEVGFDNLVRSEVTAGANLLAVQSNDADFELDGQLSETEQQVAMAQIDAIASNRAVVYASTTGESAIIAPDGSLIARSGTWYRTELEARVPLRSQLTLADRVGAWPELTITALTVIAFGWALAGAARERRSRRVAPAASSGTATQSADTSVPPSLRTDN